MSEERGYDRERDDDHDRGYRDRGDRDRSGGGTGGKRTFARRRVCRFCADENARIDYKDSGMLRYFVTDRGKVVPRRISGNCAKHQRAIGLAIRRARMLALLPFSVTGR